MSVEAMSGGISMGAGASSASSIGGEAGVGTGAVGFGFSSANAEIGASLDQAIGPTISLDSPAVNVGGSHNPEMNNGLFSQTEPVSQIHADVFGTTKELENPLVELLDKTVPENFLTKTTSIWQAPTVNTVEKPTVDVFKDTVEIKLPAIELFDKTVPSELLINSESIQQAPEKADDMIAPAETLVEMPLPDVEIIEPAENLVSRIQDEQTVDMLNVYLAQEFSVDQPKTEISKILEAHPLTMQELKADVQHAVKIKEALISIGTAPDEAEKYALKVLTQVEEQKEMKKALKKNVMLPALPPKPQFEHDAGADGKRKEYVLKAVEEVVKKVEEGMEDKITGEAVAEAMPEGQPDDVKSKILPKESMDGSYEHLIVDLSKIDELTPESAMGEIEKIIVANHAVKKGSVSQATDKEIAKVLKGKPSLF